MAGGRSYEEELRVAGIQPGSTFERIAYNRSSDTVVAQFRSGRVGMLYYRNRRRRRYRKVAQLGERVSYRDVITADAAPMTFVNVLEFGTEAEGGDWLGVARMDMQTRKIALVFCEEDIKLSLPYSRGWVRNLLEAWADGRGVVCIISFIRRATSTEKKRWHSRRGTDEIISAGEHWICDLDLEQKRCKRLTLLRAMYF
jgi:hypothetical protein